MPLLYREFRRLRSLPCSNQHYYVTRNKDFSEEKRVTLCLYESAIQRTGSCAARRNQRPNKLWVERASLLRGFESKYWGWWYVSIGIGFLLLAIVNTMRGASLAGIAIRVVIAIGFEVLGWIQFKTGR